MTTTARLALGTAALFVGGLLGGLLGSALFASRSTPTGGVGVAERVLTTTDESLSAAIEALTRELRVRDVPAVVDGGEREVVRADGTTAPTDFGEVVAAMDRLTRALERSPAGGATGGVGVTPLVLPGPGNRPDQLAQLVGRDWQELSREYRLWTYQQVLDRFGRPDEISSGAWLYRLVQGGQGHTFTFNFQDGYLTNVYP